MKRKRYSEEKIISILKEHETRASATDSSRRHRVAEETNLATQGVLEASGVPLAVPPAWNAYLTLVDCAPG